MKHLLITTIGAVFLVGCGKPSNPEADCALFFSIQNAHPDGRIERVKKALAAGADVNVKAGGSSETKDFLHGLAPLHEAVKLNEEEITQLLITKGANVNAKNSYGKTPLDSANCETADLLRKHGSKTAKELKTEGN